MATLFKLCKYHFFLYEDDHILESKTKALDPYDFSISQLLNVPYFLQLASYRANSPQFQPD